MANKHSLIEAIENCTFITRPAGWDGDGNGIDDSVAWWLWCYDKCSVVITI